MPDDDTRENPAGQMPLTAPSPATVPRMDLAEFAAALIAVFEGERLMAYPDSGGVWTIGIGHTGPDVHASLTITHEEALELFRKDAKPILTAVSVKGLPTTAAAAYVSFGFNTGYLSLLRVLDGMDTINNPRHTMDRHGNVLPGLVARRRLEMALIAIGTPEVKANV